MLAKLNRTVCLILYYGFARHLPCSYSRIGGALSSIIRRFLCKKIFLRMGENVIIEHGAYFGRGDRIEIGNNSGIGINSYIYGNTKIGNDVMMGPNVRFQGSKHITSRVDIPMRIQGIDHSLDVVIIEDDVWIGRDVLILGSKTIRTGSIIAARCVLTKNFPEYSVVGGNPSKLIKSRK